jgi:malonyl-CoA/methylmalonyl-CoA synthetase
MTTMAISKRETVSIKLLIVHADDVVVRREGEYWFILGRASLDIIKSGGYKISALDVEREILSLTWVSEVIVVGVADEEFGQRVGAILTLREDSTPVSLSRLRSELRDRIVGYKMPTLLRVVEELPKTSNGKVLKKVLGPKYFHDGYRNDPEVQVWEKKQSKI